MTRPRHRAREAALQILYLWEVGRADPDEAIDAYFEAHEADMPDAARAFAADIVRGTAAAVAELDDLIGRHSTRWRVTRLAIIDRLILRMAAWELRYHEDTPPAVVLDEALELTRTFSSDDAVRFVNGVLDGIRKSLTNAAES
jgi:N utilization substance protein B